MSSNGHKWNPRGYDEHAHYVYKLGEPLIALLNHVLDKNPQFDSKQVHLYGGSYGGYLGALLGSRYPTRFKSATILNGVLNNAAMMWFTDIPEWVTA